MLLKLYWCPECKRLYTKVLVSGENHYGSAEGYYCTLNCKGEPEGTSESISEEDFSHAYILVECPAKYHSIIERESNYPLESHWDAIARIEDILEDYTVEIEDGKIVHKGSKVGASEEEIKRILSQLL